MGQNKPYFTSIAFTAFLLAVLSAMATPHQVSAKTYAPNPFVGMVARPEDAAAFITSDTTTAPSLPPTTTLEAKAAQIFAFDTSDDTDERADRIDAYFSKHKMPLAGYGMVFVAAADKCGLDWQLLPAIAVRESSGGKRMRLNNPFGWANANVPFDDLKDAITTVGEHLCGLNERTARYYKDKSTMQKLYAYNGTVVPSYPREVVSIMKMF